MQKWIYISLMMITSLGVTSTSGYCAAAAAEPEHPPVQRRSLCKEIQDILPLRSTLRVATRRCYEDVKNTNTKVQDLDAAVKLPKKLLTSEYEDYFHHDNGDLIPGYRNAFSAGMRGCIYSVKEAPLQDKIFIAFPGTQSMVEWAFNFWGIAPTVHNTQESYHTNIEDVYAHEDDNSFRRALNVHLNAKRTEYRSHDDAQQVRNLEQYTYYFTGHSRGGGLAFLAAKKFKEVFGLPVGHVKVATFCTPRLMNARVKQSELIEALGYDNMVHFIRPSDIAPKFPFAFVENPGVHILLERDSFIRHAYRYLIHAHRIPDEGELNRSITQYNEAKDVEWLYPLRHLFTVEPKPLIWVACVLLFPHLTKNVEWRECFIKVARRFV